MLVLNEAAQAASVNPGGNTMDIHGDPDRHSDDQTADEQLADRARDVTERFPSPRERLEQLRAAIQAESISYGELAELQGLVSHIEPGDVELLEWAGVEEN